MRIKLLLPLFSFAMLMGSFAFAEEKVLDVDVSVPNAEQTLFAEENSLINAIRKGNIKKVKELIKGGADVNAKDNGFIPLTEAVLHKNADIVKLLIKAGADVNVKSDNGMTPLMYALAVNPERVDIAKLLIKGGADVNAVTGRYNYTNLMYTSSLGYKELTKLLIKSGADVNAKDGDGRTALIYASEEGHWDIVKLLIKSGADVNIKNKEGKTAADISAEREKEKNKK